MKRPQHASTRARTFGGLPPTFVAAASQQLYTVAVTVENLTHTGRCHHVLVSVCVVPSNSSCSCTRSTSQLLTCTTSLCLRSVAMRPGPCLAFSLAHRFV